MSLLDRLTRLLRREQPDLPPDPRTLSRRRFLQILGASAAVVTVAPLVDLEQLLWTPSASIVAPGPAGTWLTADLITREALRILKHNLTFVTTVDRQYTVPFTAGDIIHIPRRARYR